MKKLWLSTIRNLITALLILMLLGCAGAPQKVTPQAPSPANCWLLQTAVYRLRHSAQLEYQGKQKTLEGFMELDLIKERAHLVIFNSLGLTLLNLEIEPHQYKPAQASTEKRANNSPNRREQKFAQLIAVAVQNIFFSLKDELREPDSGKQKKVVEFTGTPLKLTKISERREKPVWTTTYNNYQKFAAGELPERISLESCKPKFNLTLWLHKAELAKKEEKITP